MTKDLYLDCPFDIVVFKLDEPKIEIRTEKVSASAFPIGRRSRYQKVLEDLRELEPDQMLQVSGAKLPSLRAAIKKLPGKYQLAERDGIVFVKPKGETKKTKK